MTAYRDTRSRNGRSKPSYRNNVELIDGDMIIGPFGDYGRLRPALKTRPRRVTAADLKAAS